MHKLVLENKTHKKSGIFYTNRSPNFKQKARPSVNLVRMRTCRLADYAVLADNRGRIKGCVKIDKYFNLDRELKSFRT